MKQQTKQPLVSVIMPVYNASRYLARAVKSIQKQTYQNLEIICVDDVSQDDSFSILTGFARKDKRIKTYHLPKHSGASTAANHAIQKAKGRFLARMDADDIALPNRITRQVAYLQNNHDVIGVGGQCIRINERGTVLGMKEFTLDNENIRSMLFRSMPIQQPTLMVNRKKLPDWFVWYNKHIHIVEDYDLFYRLMQYGKLANLPIPLIKYREHKNGQTFRSPKRTFWLIWQTRLIALTRYGYVPDLFSVANVLAQTIIALLVPEKLLYPIHMATRSLFFRRNIYSHV